MRKRRAVDGASVENICPFRCNSIVVGTLPRASGVRWGKWGEGVAL